MRTSTKKKLTLAVALSTALLLAGCAGASGSGSSGDGGTVAVDVGTGTPINLNKGPLRLALLMNDTSNEWEQNVVQGAQDAAKSYGWTLDVLNPGFDVQKQLNQIQTIATSGRYDAVLAIPVDGALTCTAFSQTLPQANILVSIGATQLCDRSQAEGDNLWQPGTLNWVGGTGVTAQYIRSWLDVAVKMNPGPQKAVILMGPQVITVSQTTNTILDKEFIPAHPDFVIADRLYTDFTTPDTYQKVLDYLTAHPDINVVLSTYSPDMTRGAIEAINALGRTGITIADSGGAKYTFDQIAAGAIQFTSPLFPRETGQYMVDSIKAAQDGKAPQRFISDIPPALGSLTNLPIFTKDNMSTFTPEF
ncbi:sugar ABC transporter substrate-binding protein [Microbacterium sp. X-17]|uniref:sugar ABC transporter substrate-binding protein n=1 Tax=Microbacterium sp. X-17 TaxID=3144404 RepID=UPI0031F4AEFC